MSAALIIVLSIGTMLMLVPILVLMKQYNLGSWKSIPVTILLTLTGTLSTYIWFYIENFRFGGRSFYGAVFLVPLAFALLAKLLRIPHAELTDLCAPAECIMLAIMKIQCIREGCCAGKVLYVTATGGVCFPSQIVELVNALLVFTTLMLLSWNKNYRGKIYPLYMIIYGASRFCLNWFRADSEVYALGMPAGNLWSLIAIIVGIVWLNYRNRIKTKNNSTDIFCTSQRERQEKPSSMGKVARRKP